MAEGFLDFGGVRYKLADNGDGTVALVVSGTLTSAALDTAYTGSDLADAIATIDTEVGVIDGIVDTITSNVTNIVADNPRPVRKTITYVAATTSYAAFTVTGTIAVRVVGYVSTALTNHADSTSVGTATDPDGLIAATAGTAMQTVGQVWVNATPSKFVDMPSGFVLIGNGEDISVVGTANITGGVVVLVAFWFPVSSDGALVAA